jgi:hypothetical protein
MFETIHFNPERMIDNWIEKAWIDHENIGDFFELENGVLKVYLKEDNSYILSRSYTGEQLAEKIKEMEITGKD